MVDDLDRPLGLPSEAGPSAGWLPRARLVALLATASAIFAGGYWLLARGDRLGGEPHALARIEIVAPSSPVQVRTAEKPPESAPAPSKSASNAEEIEAASGVKVVRSFGAQVPGALIIQVPEAVRVALAPAPDRRLVEKSRFGLLPRIGADGARPAEVYARASAGPRGFKARAPRIALLVGGMGLNAAQTAQAMRELPPEVSLAFAPYGGELDRQTEEARAQGHEIFLQTPMESFDMATDNPGPHTLLVGEAGAIADNLHWQMGRFVGYVGLVNFLGGKFSADRTAIGQVLREAANRGLDYFDDGSSAQSLALEAAQAAGLAAARPDVRLDDNARPESIDAALWKLEAIAREKGTAIGFASGLPVGVERIARFARGLDQRGLVLTPLSAMLTVDAQAAVGKR